MADPPGHGTEGVAPPATAGARVYGVLGHVGGLILAIMAGAVFIQVVLRFLGRSGIDGLEEVPRYLFVWLVMIGAAAAMWRNEHTILDYFLNLFGSRTRALIIVFTNAVSILLFAYLIKLSFTLVPNAHFQTSPGLGLSLGYVFLAIPIGSALIILPMLRNIYAALGALWQKPS
ncbi:MAG: TRAP transporter small permease [Hyphomicrobiaceae bacterium]